MSTVRNVKEKNQLKEDSATNGLQGIVSQKKVDLLMNGVKSFASKTLIC